ncbi:unnamed protein product, partial [Cladocopium goreaui]
VSILGFGYNRTNYQFDQGQRWGRFTAGRGNEIKRYAMFREDVADLAAVSVSKLKVYVPVLTMSLGYVLTVLVEARSGLKFPGPPTFASGLYLNCLGVSFAFMTLSIWLCWHAAMRAQVAMVQLRTRQVRLPVPSQRQLDSARKILSSYEEQGVYDMFRLPFVLPQSGEAPPGAEEEVKFDAEGIKGGYKKGGLPGMAAKMKGKVKDFQEEAGGDLKELGHAARMPGFTSGAPGWVEKEIEGREDMPKASPSGFGLEAPPEPYAHFEAIRQAQKDYWCAEAYARVTFLIGMMIQSFAYWLPIHCIGELGLVWGAMVCSSTLTSAVWIMFRMDVIPSHGGCFPIELGGPFIEAISLAFAYTHHPTSRVDARGGQALDVSRAVAVLVLLMQIGQTIRLYVAWHEFRLAKPWYTITLPVVSQPGNGSPELGAAQESGERLFNQAASCESPVWLPSAFQTVSYLVAPPKVKSQLEKEQRSRDHEGLSEDPMVNVDMTPWYYVRSLLLVTAISWFVLLTGRIVECTMGERMLVTNPGAPPWTRVGRWYGWEAGPITSKHYAHVTPMRGHFAWQKGWGPQGQQEIRELWASDMFGFHPEADMHWSEADAGMQSEPGSILRYAKEGPEPLVGAAGHGKNTWFEGVIQYGRRYTGEHSWLDSGGHRRLQEVVTTVRPVPVTKVVPAAVHFPPSLEPELLACSPEGTIAMTRGGMGAFLPASAAVPWLRGPTWLPLPYEKAEEQGFGTWSPVNFQGLLDFGLARSVSWGQQRLLSHTGSGVVVACPWDGRESRCSALELPGIPSAASATALALLDASEGHPFRAAVLLGDQLQLHALMQHGLGQDWHLEAQVAMPQGAAAVSLTGDQQKVLDLAPGVQVAQTSKRNGLQNCSTEGRRKSYRWVRVASLTDL